jgi:NTE family protein
VELPRGFGWARIRRLSYRPKLAVVLSGGGNLGAFQAGAIDALVRRGIRPDLIVGTSVGAINGSFWAFHFGPEAGGQLREVWSRARRARVLSPPGLRTLRGFVGRADHVFDADRASRFLAAELPQRARFEDSAVPLAVTVTDALTGERRVIRSGPVLPAVLASAAVPGAFPPVAVAGRLCFDGGIVANCDLEAVVEAGIRQTLVIDLPGVRAARPPRGLIEILARSTHFSLRRQTDLLLRSMGSRLRFSVLRANLMQEVTLGDFSRTDELFELGQEAGREWLSRHLTPRGQVVPGLFEFQAPLEPSFERPEVARRHLQMSGADSTVA